METIWKPRVWTVSERKAGTLTQCLGVGRHIDPEPKSIVVKKRLKRWLIGPLSPYRHLEGPEPDVIISCGAMAPRHVMAIAAACRKRPMTVHLQTPQDKFAHLYDLAFISRHDWTPENDRQPTFHKMMGVPHQMTVERIRRGRADARAKWAPNDERVVAVLAGGPNGAYRYEPETVDALVAAVEGLAADGWRPLVTTSRRSEPALLQRLLKLNSERVFVWDHTGDNPYFDFLASADALLITKDTITMTCEALSTGKPVYIFDLPKTPCDKLDEFEWFHADMSTTLGFTRPFAGTIETYTYDEPDESRRIAAIVAEELKKRHPPGA
jgi:hypothetical protein